MGVGDELLEQLDPEDERYEKAARNLIASKGKNRKKALLLAGFPLSVAAHDATSVINSSKFVAALMKLGVSMTNKQIGMLSKGSLIDLLSDPKLELRTRIQALRLGLEVGGEVGQNSSYLQGMNPSMSQGTIDEIAKRMVEIQQREERKNRSVTVEAINAELPQNANR